MDERSWLSWRGERVLSQWDNDVSKCDQAGKMGDVFHHHYSVLSLTPSGETLKAGGMLLEMLN